MAEILGGFNANEVEPAEAFQCLPAGQYDVAITSADAYTTNSGKFLAMKFVLAVLNGQYQNRKLYINCLIYARCPSYSGAWDSKDEQTVKIGAGKFSAMCRAVNVLTPKDTSELMAKTLRCSVSVKENPERGKQNEVTAFMPRSAMPVSQAVASQPVMQQPVMAGAGPANSPF